MKITVCQIDNIPKNFQQSFKNLSNYLSVNKTDLLLLPEMPFSKWLSKDKKPNVKKWEKAVKEHNNFIKNLSLLDAKYIIATKPTIDNNGICPEGWHVPTSEEYIWLFVYFGGQYNWDDDYLYAGGKLKEIGLDHWNNPNTGATNESGFTALPGGERLPNGDYHGHWLGWYGDGLGFSCYYWSSSVYNNEYAMAMRLHYSNTEIFWREFYKQSGYSIRCKQD